MKTTVRNLTGQSYTVETPPVREVRQPIVPFYLHADQNIRTDYSYDHNGNRTGTTDPNDIVTRFDYDALDRLTDVHENNQPGQTSSVEVNVHTEYTYDERGNRATIRSARAVLADTGEITRFSYDKLGRLTTERDPLEHGMDYGYNVLGERTSQTDALGEETILNYDALGRLVTIDYPAPDADAHFSYGPTNLRMSMMDGVGTTAWTYTALGQVKTVTDPSQKVVEYAYDGLGNRTKLIYPDQKTALYAYDKLNRLERVTDWDNQETSYTYLSTQTGFTRQVHRPNGVVTTDTLNAAGRLVDRVHAHGDTTLASYHYEYEPVGNRWQATEQVQKPHLNFLPVIMKEDAGESLGSLPEQPLTGETTAGTDNPYPAPLEPEPLDSGVPEEDAYPEPEQTSQSTSLWDVVVDFFTWLLSPADTVQASDAFQGYPPPGDPPQVTLPGMGATVITYWYDGLHRLTGASDSDGNTYTYAYDANGNRVSEQVPGGAPVVSEFDIANRLTSVGGVIYTWDDNGNLTNDGTHKYVYDRANRLKTVTDQVDVPQATYTYNGLGYRLTENNTQFVLDLNAGLTQVLQDGTYTYLYGSDRLMQESQTSTGYFLGDALGSVRQLVDENGSVTLTRTYEPYGEMASSSGISVATAYGYTGEWENNRINLLYLRSRFYSLSSGRFLTKDIWQGKNTLPMSYNAWLYGYANPVVNTDPTGMCPPGIDGDLCRKLAKSIEKTYNVTIDLGGYDYDNLLDYDFLPQLCKRATIAEDLGGIYGVPMYWKENELKSLETALKTMQTFLDKTLIVSYRSTVGRGTTTFKRVAFSSNKSNRDASVTMPRMTYGLYNPLQIQVDLTNAAFNVTGQVEPIRVATIMHELFHVVDYSQPNSALIWLTAGASSQSSGWALHHNEVDYVAVDAKGNKTNYCGPTDYGCSNPADGFATSALVYSLLFLIDDGVSSVNGVSVIDIFNNSYGVDPTNYELYEYQKDPNQWGVKKELLESRFHGFTYLP